MRISVISQKPTRSEYVRLLYSGSPPARDNIWWCEVIGLLSPCTPGRCSLAASGSEAQPNSAQSLPEIVLCTAVHCCRRLQRMLHSAMNSVPSPSLGLCPSGSGGQSSLPHCPDPFHINTTKNVYKWCGSSRWYLGYYNIKIRNHLDTSKSSLLLLSYRFHAKRKQELCLMPFSLSAIHFAPPSLGYACHLSLAGNDPDFWLDLDIGRRPGGREHHLSAWAKKY